MFWWVRNRALDTFDGLDANNVSNEFFDDEVGMDHFEALEMHSQFNNGRIGIAS